MILKKMLDFDQILAACCKNMMILKKMLGFKHLLDFHDHQNPACWILMILKKHA